ncbi:recombinase family protein [Roseomonas sp. CAU 1739]|uniref:recombinase family protein n=1 Tax=Roseomonas sp. CAU 1739 TaxID=3140364 RepID=UPI00325BA74F
MRGVLAHYHSSAPIWRDNANLARKNCAGDTALGAVESGGDGGESDGTQPGWPSKGRPHGWTRVGRRWGPTLSQLLEDGVSIRAADMPGVDDLMLRIYAAMAQEERELISERTKAALAAAKARGKVAGRGQRLPDCRRTGRGRSSRGTSPDSATGRLPGLT